ncbi:MAG TPA: acyloxyacyl hydrolase [Stellaceae bacterium]|nr:acyloxyacyl hydrolase [Stellaceae bacterium]
MTARIGCLAAAGLALLLAASAAEAEEPDLLAAAIGPYNVLRRDKEAQLRLEYRFAYRFLTIIKPVVGALATNDKSFYGYGGIRLEAVLGHRFVIMPEAVVGYWERGSGKNLGSPIEFKTGAEFAYRFADYSRIGIAFDHISNAGIGKANPGEESLLLVYSIPLGWGQ